MPTKIRHILLTMFAVLLIAGGAYYALNQPPSANYLQEHPEQFKFESYGNSASALQEAGALILKAGMAKSDVEQILIKSAGAKIRKSTEEKTRYVKKVFPGCVLGPNQVGGMYIDVFYDENLKIIEIRAGGPCL